MKIVLEIFMGVNLLSTGLFAGLMMTLALILQKQWNAMEKHEYISVLKGFLLVGKKNPVLSVVTLTSAFLPLVIAAFHFIHGDPAAGMLSLGAGCAFFIGCLVVTLRFNFPIYEQVTGWKNPADDLPWQTVRKRFHRLNSIRFAFAMLSFCLLALAHIVSS